jgi:hypothetical protein
MQLQLWLSAAISAIETLYFCISKFSKKVEVRKLKNDKEIGMNTSVPLLCEIYSQLEQSVNTNAIERTTFLSIYIAMIAVIASIINEKGQGFFQKDYTLLYIVLIGITLAGIVLVTKVNYLIYEKKFLANQMMCNYFGKIYEEYYPPYINNMSIDLLIILIMVTFLSIFLFGLLQCLPFSSILLSILISFGLFCLLTLMYRIHRRVTRKGQLLRILLGILKLRLEILKNKNKLSY